MRIRALNLIFAAAAISLPAQTLTTLYVFTGTNGSEPEATMILGANGNLFGTTLDGGTDGSGTIFEITPAGVPTTLHSFCAQGTCVNGSIPLNGLVQAVNGNFYGATSQNGAFGQGTIYEITPNGVLTKLYDFHGATDGASPSALIQGFNGNFYGLTSAQGPNNAGTVFQLTPGGVLTTLYAFCSLPACADGSSPYGNLVQASNGDLYGTTSSGGIGFGTVFKITPSGLLTTLVSFDGTNGSAPQSTLIQGSDGSIYGATGTGGAGCTSCDGTVFKMTLTGKLTTLATFSGANGSRPVGPLVEAANGSFYGTTFGGGNFGGSCGFPQGCGTIFELTPSGALTTLHVFCERTNCPDGSLPWAGLVQDTSGAFYGVTVAGGGTSESGTVFRLSAGLGPLIETQTSGSRIGAAVRILGTGLTGATNVSFNGIPAVFEVLESSVISATVPAGATTGFIQVELPSGTTLSTAVPFQVLP